MLIAPAPPEARQILVTGRFFLYDSQGNAVGASPFGEGTAKGGARLSLRVPDGVLAANHSYSWQMQACVEEVCSAKSSAVGFVTGGSAPQDPVGTHTVVLDKSKLTIRTAKTAADACGGAPCPLTDAAAVQIGGAGPDRRISLLKPDLAGVPEGAQITSAVLKLGSANCGGACPAGAKVSVHAKKTELPGSPTGAELVADLVPDPEQQSDLSAAQLDVTGNVRQWRQETPDDAVFVDPGLVLFADETLPVTTTGAASGQTPISLAIEYLPPTAPGKITTVQTRAGDAAVLLTWGKPETPGADVSVGGYDIQVLNAAGDVVRTLESERDRTVVSGLTNGTSYRFQVRARTAYGSGPWQTSGSVTPQAVVGAVRFVEAAQQFVAATEGLRDKRYANTGEAVSGDSQAAAITSILYTSENSLLTGGAPQRNTSEIGLSQTLVSTAADGSVVVRTRITGKTTYDAEGTPLESGWEDQSDFVFAIRGSGLQLTRQNSSEAADASADIDGVEINAWAGGIPDDPAPPLAELQRNGGVNENAVLAGSPSGAASWAVKNVGGPSRAGWEYPNDCANFVSRALSRGGRYRQIHANSWSWLDKRNNASWWEGTKAGDDSWTFAAAQKNYNHFIGQKRVTIRQRFTEAQVGDIVYFVNRKTDLISHMGIVTYRPSTVPVRSIWDLYFAQHGGQNGTGSGPYMVLGERYDPKEFKGLIFAKVNW
ncbi:amidase domain-containing protein [Streptosporangium canum]|uniref:amidase domain-containing protein n=1 Tax=Streptosporangium canum TaxID=324952 RepID=UPI003431E74B